MSPSGSRSASKHMPVSEVLNAPAHKQTLNGAAQKRLAPASPPSARNARREQSVSGSMKRGHACVGAMASPCLHQTLKPILNVGVFGADALLVTRAEHGLRGIGVRLPITS
jgi:hypothetical protein